MIARTEPKYRRRRLVATAVAVALAGITLGLISVIVMPFPDHAPTCDTCADSNIVNP